MKFGEFGRNGDWLYFLNEPGGALASVFWGTFAKRPSKSKVSFNSGRTPGDAMNFESGVMPELKLDAPSRPSDGFVVASGTTISCTAARISSICPTGSDASRPSER